MTTNDKARLENLLRRYFEEKAQPQAPIVWHVDKTPMQKAIVDIEGFFDSIHGGHGDIDDSCTCHLIGQTCDACNRAYQKESEVSNGNS